MSHTELTRRQDRRGFLRACLGAAVTAAVVPVLPAAATTGLCQCADPPFVGEKVTWNFRMETDDIKAGLRHVVIRHSDGRREEYATPIPEVTPHMERLRIYFDGPAASGGSLEPVSSSG